ncbi:PspC domain-containing protein [Gryllotalpicola ginsengisoli]|uniref:PspC domain-containing protein n=1 Tax=Gryllotalpicola ginsengisoli TaxID=444608 RepID=UPI00040AEC2D|nr:PspC domain-containing protein [Gryllotalpicola ginsengisoli]
MTNQTSSPQAPEGAPTPPPSNRFFTWLRSLGVVRADGWLGGVCGGIAIRTGLDPLIVRGIVVVVAVLGGPAFLFYAAAWLLLPDTHGDIHLERMLRGVFDAPLIGIGILVLLSFLPVAQGVWWAGDGLVGSPWWAAAPAALFRVLWNLAIIALIVWFVVWVVQRVRGASQQHQPSWKAQNSSPYGGTDAPVADSRGGGTAAQDRTASDAGAAAAPGTTAAAEVPPEVPAAPSAGASKDDMTAWREQYAAWREQHAAWQEQQRAEQRRLRDLRSAEMRAQSQAIAANAEEQRRLRRAANPRVSGWFVALALGVALLAGGIAGATAAQEDALLPYAGPIGFASALLALGVAMMVAGAVRRRSGVLAFFAIVTIVLGVASFGWPRNGAPVGYSRYDAGQDRAVSQFAGQVEVDAAAADVPDDGVRHIEIQQSFGSVAVYVATGVEARVVVHSTDSRIRPYVYAAGFGQIEKQTHAAAASDGRTATASYETPAGGAARLVVEVSQGHGAVYVYYGGGDAPNSGNRIDEE